MKNEFDILCVDIPGVTAMMQQMLSESGACSVVLEMVLDENATPKKASLSFRIRGEKSHFCGVVLKSTLSALSSFSLGFLPNLTIPMLNHQGRKTGESAAFLRTSGLHKKFFVALVDTKTNEPRCFTDYLTKEQMAVIHHIAEAAQ
ncbi:hypothetical protein [Propionivibrio sp.]|uniref:hypothetical protein n=1 Tax=Propionivibrio sp. TaxID=2212460 RepID=UPI003BF2B519